MPEIILTDASFDKEVLQVKEPTLVDFWAPWCGPCRIQGPIVSAVASEVSGVRVGKLNVDENPEVAGRYGIMSIPTLIIFKNGQVAEQMVGLQQKNDLRRKLEVLAKS